MAQVRREVWRDGALQSTEMVEVADAVVNESVLVGEADAVLAALRSLAQSSGNLSTAAVSNGLRTVARALIVVIRLHLRRLDTTD